MIKDWKITDYGLAQQLLDASKDLPNIVSELALNQYLTVLHRLYHAGSAHENYFLIYIEDPIESYIYVINNEEDYAYFREIYNLENASYYMIPKIDFRRIVKEYYE